MNFLPLLQASTAIHIHVVAAVAAFLLGGVVLFRRKGDRLHRIGGRVWVTLMLVVAVSSFFIHTINLWGIWSPIHLVSVGTLVSLAYGVWLIRKHNVTGHRNTMRTTYAGALIIAGIFTFLPGRIMYEVFFEGPSPAVGIAVMAVIVLGGMALLARGLRAEVGA
ncbi:MAG: DUF2306 domain-containing protein [Rhizobiaceae bacterium]